ncbi:MAG: phytoene desaturase [Actinobacteria bacterium]|nr:phytoene desaturase [Actinomycetota bacterium]
MSQIAVIGAGMGGMCAAARLAKAGHKVDVYEYSETYGGKCRTERIGNTAFDIGPSLLTLPAVYRDFFLKTGDPLDSVVQLEPVNPSFDYRFSDGSSVQFSNLSRYDTLNAIRTSFGVQAASDWSRLMARAGSMWDVSRKPFVESELKSIASLALTPSILKDITTIAPWKSLQSIVTQMTRDTRLQYIAQRYATYSGSDPRHAPAVLLSIAYIEEAFGAWHVAGGTGKLAQAVYERAVETGVNFNFNSRVVRINHDGKKVVGITLLDNSSVLADIVVANADASQVYNQLIPEKLRSLRRPRVALKKATPSVAGFSIMIGTTRQPGLPSLAHHTILFPSDYDEEFNSIFSTKSPVKDPAIYICAPGDPLMNQDPDIEGWTILVNAPRHSQDSDGWDWTDEQFANEYANSIFDKVEARGIPIRDRIAFYEIRTPADLQSSVLAPGGSIYGTSSNGARAAFSRARNRSPLAGLFCVGGSAHPGGGLPLVAISAEIVSNIVGRA